MKNKFDIFFKFFKTTPLWYDMVNTCENSKWHREENTGRHTEMLIEWYMNNLYSSRTDEQRMLTLVACCFHDVGKPPAQVVKTSEERGEYRSYAGHEGLSARLWIDFAYTYPDVIESLRMSVNDVHFVAYIIEHHLPFDMKNAMKRKRLKDGLISRKGEMGNRIFLDLLLSDQHGRCGDTQADNEKEVDEWIEEWSKV